MSEERCPNCGAMVAEGADWCGLCFTPLSEAAKAVQAGPEHDAGEAETADGAAPLSIAVEAAGSGGMRIEVEDDAGEDEPPPERKNAETADAAGTAARTVWQCPVCEHENPIEESLCEVCGTPFGRLFEQDRPSLDPDRAAILGLIPGLAHQKLGMTTEAVARMVVGIGCLLLGLLFASSAAGSQRLALTLLFLLGLLGAIAESSYDGRRAAVGDPQLVQGRWLVYGFGGLFVVAIIIVVVTSTRLTPDELPGGPPVQDVPVVDTVPPEPSPTAPAVVPSPAFPSPSLSPSETLTPDPFASPTPVEGVTDVNGSPVVVTPSP